LKNALTLLAALLLSPLAAPHAAEAKPNIVLILADDLGWSDLGCYGADLHETPHLDKLAQQGMRFTDAYAMSVCTPSRAALLTGKHAARLKMTIWSEGSLGGPKNRKLIQADSLHDLPQTESTLARHLQKAGYLTALVGKWHLGDASHYPETHGFDVNIGGTQWGAPQTFFWPYSGSGRFGPEFRYFHYPHYHATTTPVSAVRAGDWKLLEYLEDGHLELYNLLDDLSEKTDLALHMPDKTTSLLKQLHEWRNQVGAAMPIPNPVFK
jgi:arylsulfatase A-like enzyme